MCIRLSEERRTRLGDSIKQYFVEHFAETRSDCRAERLVDFSARELGPPVDNQAIRDAYPFIHDTLTALEGEWYKPKELYAR